MQINKSRLQVLRARDQVLEEVVEETKKHLRGISTDETKYCQLLEKLILQVSLIFILCADEFFDRNVVLVSIDGGQSCHHM